MIDGKYDIALYVLGEALKEEGISLHDDKT